MRSKLSGLDMGRRFYLLWFGESIALVGAALVEFALGVWVYQHTGSVADFAGVVISAIWPPILILPLAGGLADRTDRRLLILAVDLSLVLLVLGLVVLLSLDRLEPSHLYVFNSLTSIAASLRLPAYKAAVSTVLDKDKYVRASGLMGLGNNVNSALAPLMAGFLMGSIGLGGILLLDLTCFVLGLMFVYQALFGMSAPASARPARGGSLLHDALGGFWHGLTYFRAQRVMVGLLVYEAVQIALLVLASMMVIPLVLASHGPEQLGFVYTCAALGGFAGALVQVVLRNPRRLMLMAVSADVVLSACIVAIGMGDSVIGYGSLAFATAAAAGVAEGCISALWMRKVPAQHLGSVIAVSGMLSQLTLMMMMMGGGLAIDQVLRPSLAPGGFLAQHVGEWFDAGKRGPVALLFVGSGLLGLLICIGCLASRKLRQLDLLVPDHDAGSERSEAGPAAADGSKHVGGGRVAPQPVD
jgi:diaminobutyrate-2-oxoglutarate transaminase